MATLWHIIFRTIGVLAVANIIGMPMINVLFGLPLNASADSQIMVLIWLLGEAVLSRMPEVPQPVEDEDLHRPDDPRDLDGDEEDDARD